MNRALLVLAVALAGCPPRTDLNKPCTLVRANPDGGAPIALTEGEVRAKQGFNKDFIVRTVECDDFICVRDSKFVSSEPETAAAQGYCSSPCIQGSKCVSYDEALDKGAQALACRALLLDKETLANLAGDGGLGNVRDPYFCARGQSTDAGTP